MKVQYEHKVISSFLLFIDNELCSRGKAYTNYGTPFYPVDNQYQNYFTYGSPFKQFVFDDSIGLVQGDRVRKPNVISGIYLDNQYIVPGESGLVSIDHNMGQVHFDQDYPDALGVLPSGNYAIKDFNIYLTNEPENVLLFETQFKINPKVEQSPTGLPPTCRTYPAIYVKNLTSTNEGIGFPSAIDTEMHLRSIVLSDSAYNLDACCALLKDTKKRRVAIIGSEDQPFGSLGYTGGDSYNYRNAISGSISPDGWGEKNSFIVDEVNVSKKSQNRQDFDRLNTEVFIGFIDFTLKNIRDI